MSSPQDRNAEWKRRKQEEDARRKRRSRRVKIIAAIVCIGLLIWGGFGIADWQARANAEGDHRDAAISGRLPEIERATNGAVTVHKPYNWRHDKKRINVDVTVGTCTKVNGYFRSPASPAGPQDISELFLEVPGLDQAGSVTEQVSEIPITDSSLYAKLTKSALAHCVAGDKRLDPAQK